MVMKGNNPNAINTLLRETFSYNVWRESFLKVILYSSTVIGFIVAIANSIDMIHNNEIVLAAFYGLVWLAILIVTVSRWPYTVKVWTFLIVIYGLALSGLLENGMRGDARLMFFAFVILTALMINPRMGIANLVLSQSTIVIVAVLIFTGHLSLYSRTTAPGDPFLWVVSSLTFLLMAVIVLAGLNLFLREFKQSEERMEAALKGLVEERMLMRALIDNIPDAIYTKDMAGRKTLTNNAYMKLVGAQTETDQEANLETTGAANDIYDLFHAEDELAFQTGEPWINHEELVNTPGQPRWFLTSRLPLRNNEGAMVGMLGIGRDITQKKQQEDEIYRLNADLEARVKERTAQLESANRELEAFSYSVSHDLRAPLRAISGFINIIWQEYPQELNTEVLKYLGRVQANVAKMTTLIEDMLNFSHIDRQPVKKQAVDLGKLAWEVYSELTEGQKDGRQIEFTIGALPDIAGDLVLLRQVFTNLIGNAIKYTRRVESTRIEVGCIPQENQNVIFVRDNGAGFNMKYIDKLFVVFQRLHREEEFEGTGVGLAIAKRIIEKHNGQIWAESEVGKGATFYFTIGD